MTEREIIDRCGDLDLKQLDRLINRLTNIRNKFRNEEVNWDDVLRESVNSINALSEEYLNNGEQLRLFTDCCDGFSLSLNESVTDRGLTKFRGKFQEADAVNKNKRIYPFGILESNQKGLMPVIKARGLVGELDHPTDSIVHFEKCSHLITNLWWEGNSLMGEGEILNTPMGKILKSIISDGVRVGISSRGVGNGRSDENGILVIGESYKLITFDAVVDPSTNGAFQKEVFGNKKESFAPTPTEQNVKNAAKNNNSRIHTNKDALIAFVGGFIEQQTSNLKARLG